MRIGHRLKRSRLARKLSRRDLAELAGVKSHTLARIERNAQQPLPATVRKLAAALGIDVETLAPRWKAVEGELARGGRGGHPGYGLRIIRAKRSLATLAAVAKIEVSTLSRFERCLTQTCGITNANGAISSDALAHALGYTNAKQLDRVCRVIREDGSVPPRDDDDPEPDDPLGMMDCV